MKRRRLLGSMGGTLALLALPALAQAPRRIAYLIGGDAGNFTFTLEPFRRGMSELGYSEGRDFVIEVRAAQGRTERNPELLADLLRWGPDLIVVTNSEAGLAAHRATKTVPIVFTNSADPVAAGLAQTLARPGANATGLSNQTPEAGQKQLELLRTVMPRLARLAVLVNPSNRSMAYMPKPIEAAASKLGIQATRLAAANADEIDKAFATAARDRQQAMIVLLDALFVQQRTSIARSALQHKMPSMFSDRGHVEAGGLMSYGPDIRDLNRRAAAYADRILKGAKAGDLPIEQPTQFELAVNVKTAKSLGLQIPRDVLARADRVIE